MVKVVPKNDSIRKLLKHPTAGPFRTEGSSDWPDDSFTARRMADGDVILEQHAEKKVEQHEEDKPNADKAAEKAKSAKARE